ncbi:MAG TPA: acyltransferase [Solirubrobacterales bacterium]|nr:acyltransferase [Solirubrobacterales bacterium]
MLPAVGVLIAVVMILAVFFDFGQISRLRADALASMGYVTNWELISSHQSYFEQFARPSLFRHLWSLAVEEQFYLLWPIVFAACMTRFGHRRLLVGVIAGALASTLLMLVLFDPANPNRVFYGTDTRATPLLVGVALAFLWHPDRLRATTGRLAPAVLDAIGAFGLSMVVITFMTVHDYDLSLYSGGFLLLSLWSALLIAALAHPAAQIGRVVGNAAMRWLGLRSDSFYLCTGRSSRSPGRGSTSPSPRPRSSSSSSRPPRRWPISRIASSSSRSAARGAGAARTGCGSAGSGSPSA